MVLFVDAMAENFGLEDLSMVLLQVIDTFEQFFTTIRGTAIPGTGVDLESLKEGAQP